MKTYILKPKLQEGHVNKMEYFPIVVIPDESKLKKLSQQFDLIEIVISPVDLSIINQKLSELETKITGGENV